MKSHGILDFEERCQQRHDAMGQDCFVAAAIAGSAVIGAGTSLFSGSQQASATEKATADANKIQQDEYNQTRADQAPYRDAGYGALKTITSDQANGTGFAKPFDMNSFYSDPGYQFTLQQGQTAINNSAAARGGALNGGTLKAGMQYASGLANTTYGDAYNRYLQTSNQQYNQLAGVAGLGQTAVQSTQAAGTNYANQTSQNTIGGATTAAAERASGYAGAANSLSSGVGAYYGMKQGGYGSAGYGPPQGGWNVGGPNYGAD